MSSSYLLEREVSAVQNPCPATVLNHEPFDFGNVKRNTFMLAKGMKPPVTMKTGTTIAGVVFKDGVVLGADTRATAGPIVADPNCAKIHYISKFIRCCGAGTSADLEGVTDLIRSKMELHRLATGQEPRVATAMTRFKQHLFQYQGNVSAYLVLGGVDVTGSYLYSVHAHGSVDKLPYATMGSGSLAAMAVFEAGYRDDLSMKEAMDLVHAGISAGIFNDLGSGSNVDLAVITREGTTYHRNYDKPNQRTYRRQLMDYGFKRGTTEWLKDTEKIFKSQIAITNLNDNSSSASKDKEKDERKDKMDTTA